ncbi:MAG TPA: allophanate hydrolase subunit 1 [Catenuloplanes sp.]|jgi:KipI family sensor histidine kinase inhibitor
MRLRPVGAHALLVECADAAQADAWRAELWRRRSAGELAAVEIIPGARTVLLDGVDAPAALADLLRGWPPPVPATPAEAPLIRVPTVFDGVDLEPVARLWGVPPGRAVAELAGTELRVAFCGFAPGFAYLSGLPAERAVPRHDVPRPRVAAGSVALAGRYAGIYPGASPGGWQLVGRTDLTLFDVRRDPPALLVPGTRVRLMPA